MEFIEIFTYFSIYIGVITTTFFVLSFYSNRKKNIFPELSEEKLPIVSVLIPAYNEEEGIVKTIQSALDSNYPRNKLEIIVIDDGSKDKTLELANTMKSEIVQVLSKTNGGKSTALNLGISKAKGEIVITMDADTTVDKNSIIRMVQLFQEEGVVAVCPTMITNKPKTLFQRVQYIEYVMGLFLKKVFSGIDSVYVASGAFSAYKKSFFDEYGGYDVGNITEDLEMSLRIQSNNFKIRNCPEALAYTNSPEKFKQLMVQRRRWYVGQIRNTIKYKHLFSKKYGDLGVFIFPLVWLTTIISVIMIFSMIGKTFLDVKKELLFLQMVQFNFIDQISINLFAIERFLFLLLTSPSFWFVFIFVILYVVYIKYASKKMGQISGLFINMPIFLVLFSILYGFWWVSSIIYYIFSREVKWR